MTLKDYKIRNIPSYYDLMYLDGFKPWQILESARRSILEEYEERTSEQDGAANIKIITEVKK